MRARAASVKSTLFTMSGFLYLSPFCQSEGVELAGGWGRVGGRWGGGGGGGGRERGFTHVQAVLALVKDHVADVAIFASSVAIVGKR